jgi:hypothetical protein
VMVSTWLNIPSHLSRIREEGSWLGMKLNKANMQKVCY